MRKMDDRMVKSISQGKVCEARREEIDGLVEMTIQSKVSERRRKFI